MFPDRFWPERFFANRYWPPGDGAVPPVVAVAPVGGHFLPEYERPKRRRNLSKEVRAAIAAAQRELRGEVERVVETTGVRIVIPVAAEVRSRLAEMLADNAPDYLTPIEAARQLVIHLIAEQNRRDEEEAIVIVALGA